MSLEHPKMKARCCRGAPPPKRRLPRFRGLEAVRQESTPESPFDLLPENGCLSGSGRMAGIVLQLLQAGAKALELPEWSGSEFYPLP